jgi:hypothetical protein
MTSDLRRFGPTPDNAHYIGEPCAACKQPFQAGDYTTLVPLGPADDPEQRKRAREGRVYNAVAALVHYACATGIEEVSDAD